MGGDGFGFDCLLFMGYHGTGVLVLDCCFSPYWMLDTAGLECGFLLLWRRASRRFLDGGWCTSDGSWVVFNLGWRSFLLAYVFLCRFFGFAEAVVLDAWTHSRMLGGILLRGFDYGSVLTVLVRFCWAPRGEQARRLCCAINLVVACLPVATSANSYQSDFASFTEHDPGTWTLGTTAEQASTSIAFGAGL